MGIRDGAPSSVTDALPVAGPLPPARPVRVTGPLLYEKASVTLETTTPAVTRAASEAKVSPPLLLPCTALDDTHTDAGLALAPSRTATLVATPVTLEPSSVTLVAPVGGLLVATTPLAEATACENARVTESTTRAAERAAVRADPPKDDDTPLHATALDDTHVVVAPPVWPSRPPALEPAPRKLALIHI